jgi:hypothetical protein
LGYKPPLFVSNCLPTVDRSIHFNRSLPPGGNLVVRPSTKIVGLVLSCSLAIGVALGGNAWAQPGAGSYKPPSRDSATVAARRPGSAQRAAYQDPAAPVDPPAELPAPPQGGAPGAQQGPAVNAIAPGPQQPYYDYPSGEPPMFEDGGAYSGYGYGYNGPLGFGVLGGLWVRGEYLAWDMKGMYTPPLVISSDINNIQPVDLHLNDNGDLGVTAPITILFGGNRLNNGVQSGAKVTIGGWLDNCRTVGIEGDYFGLATANDSFFQNSANGDPILARPFYNVLTGLESSELVAFPVAVNGVLHRGSIAVDSGTQFHGAGARAIINLGCNSGCGTSWWNGCPQPTMGRVDVLVGYRYLRLNDSLTVTENSSLNPGGTFNLVDNFNAENTFNGVDFGMLLTHQRGCMSVELLSKIALGNTRSQVDIGGNSTITPAGGAPQQFVGGILAQRTNIGRYQDDDFAVVPELGLTFGYQLNPCWKVTAGYTWLYWSRVARAGDQIDRDLNPDLIPEEANPPANDHLRPEFRFVRDDFWVHGLRLGLEAIW